MFLIFSSIRWIFWGRVRWVHLWMQQLVHTTWKQFQQQICCRHQRMICRQVQRLWIMQRSITDAQIAATSITMKMIFLSRHRERTNGASTTTVSAIISLRFIESSQDKTHISCRTTKQSHRCLASHFWFRSTKAFKIKICTVVCGCKCRDCWVLCHRLQLKIMLRTVMTAWAMTFRLLYVRLRKMGKFVRFVHGLGSAAVARFLAMMICCYMASSHRRAVHQVSFNFVFWNFYFHFIRQIHQRRIYQLVKQQTSVRW